MVEFSEEKYLLKGWSEEDIKKTKEILERAKLRNSKDNKTNFIIFILLIVLGNIIFTTVLAPLLITGSNFVLYLMNILFALILGVFYLLIIKELNTKKLEKIIHPLVTFCVFLSHYLINRIIAGQLENVEAKILVSLIYTVIFLIPYLFHKLKR